MDLNTLFTAVIPLLFVGLTGVLLLLLDFASVLGDSDRPPAVDTGFFKAILPPLVLALIGCFLMLTDAPYTLSIGSPDSTAGEVKALIGFQIKPGWATMTTFTVVLCAFAGYRLAVYVALPLISSFLIVWRRRLALAMVIIYLFQSGFASGILYAILSIPVLRNTVIATSLALLIRHLQDRRIGISQVQLWADYKSRRP